MSEPVQRLRRASRRAVRCAATIVGVVAVATAVTVVAAGPAAQGSTPTTTLAATTTAVPPASLPPPADEESDPVRALLPSIVTVREELGTASERQSVVAAALADGSNTVAVESPPETLCAVVPIPAPLMAAGRWERNGEPVASAELLRRDPPGYGDCITADDTGDFADGAYQYVVIGESGAMSGPATVVVGAAPVVVWLLNDRDGPVCLVQASPTDADFYEAFQTDSDLLAGEALAITLAAVDHDVRIFGCPPDDVLHSFDLAPEGGVYVELSGGAEPVGSTPASTAGPTTTTG